MSAMSEQQQQERRAECEVAAETQVVEFVHGLGTEDVDISAYDGEGNPMGVPWVTPISPDEVEVVVVPGTTARLVAVPRPPEDEG